MYLENNSLRILRAALLLLGLALALPALVLFPASTARAQQAANCHTAPPSADPSASVCISRVLVPFNGISPDNQFFVSWRTPTAVKGQVVLGGGGTFDDVRGANYQGMTHYINVSNIAAKKSYTFDIISGGTTYTHSGAHWSLKMGPAVQSTNPYTIFGRVKNPDGSDADGAVVFAQIRDADNQGTTGRSAYLSAVIVLADGGNFFTIDLDEARTQNLAQKFVFDPEMDRVQIIAVGTQGMATKTFNISELHPPAPAPSLQLSNSGTGTVATATPSLVPPTLTPTFTLTATPTATVTATHTVLPVTPSETVLPPTETIEQPTIENSLPTLEAVAETEVAETETPVAIPAGGGDEVEPEKTRVFVGVPTVIPPPPAPNNNGLIITLAVVFIVGALLLGAAAFFVLRR